MRAPTVLDSRHVKPKYLDERVHPVTFPEKSRTATTNTNPHAVPNEGQIRPLQLRTFMLTVIEQTKVSFQTRKCEVLAPKIDKTR